MVRLFCYNDITTKENEMTTKDKAIEFVKNGNCEPQAFHKAERILMVRTVNGKVYPHRYVRQGPSLTTEFAPFNTLPTDGWDTYFINEI